MSPKASFVIPAYNADPFLRKTLDSCLGQSVEDIEILVINDGSKDGTEELLNHYARLDKRILPVHLEKNTGRSEARNVGNGMATGEIILVLDADDMAMRDRVKLTLATFEKHNPDLVYGGYETMDTFGNMGHRYAPEPFSKEKSLKHKTHFILHSTLAYRKGVVRNVQYQKDPYDKLGIDDWRFIWDCCLKGYKFSYTKQPLSYYRHVDDSISNVRKEEDVIKAKDQFLATIS